MARLQDYSNMKQFITHSPSETEQVASQFAQKLKPGDVIAYRGGLGVGKPHLQEALRRDCK